MVTSHHSGHLLVLIACFSLLSLPSDGATVYGLPRQLDDERHLEEDPIQEGAVFLGGATRLGGNTFLRGNSIASSSTSTSSTASDGKRDQGQPLQPYVPERYILVSPEEHFLMELFLHSAPPPPPPPPPPPHHHHHHDPSRPMAEQRTGDVTTLPLPQDMDQQLQRKLPSLDPTRVADQPQQQLQLYLKQRRVSQQPQMQPKQRYQTDGGLKVAQKRWWGGNHRRGQIDRRASQNKYYDCLKSCIKEGQLHPIQCHTLC